METCIKHNICVLILLSPIYTQYLRDIFWRSQVLPCVDISLMSMCMNHFTLFSYIDNGHPTSHSFTLLDLGHPSLQFFITFPNNPFSNESITTMFHDHEEDDFPIGQLLSSIQGVDLYDSRAHKEGCKHDCSQLPNTQYPFQLQGLQGSSIISN